MLLPVAVIGAVLANNPVGLVLGISPASPVGVLLFSGLSLLLFSLPIQGATSVATRLCYGAGDTRGPVGSSVVGSLLIALSAAPFVATFGFAGLAAAVLFGEGVECLLLLLRLRSHVGGHLLRELMRMLAMALAAAASGLALALALSAVARALAASESLALHALIDASAAAAGLLLYLLLSARLKAPGSDAPIAALRRAWSALR